MSDDRPSSPFSRAGPGRWLVLSLALVLLQALPNLSYPIGRDQATYGVIGRGLLHGARLYRDLWDNKPPGIFYIYAAIVKIYGPALWSVGLLDILWLLAISACLFCFAWRTLGTPAAFLAVQVNAAMHLRAGYWDAGQPETFVMLFIFSSYFLLANRGRGLKLKEAGAGVLFAAAFWTKYNALAFLPFLLLVPYWQPEKSDGRASRIKLALGWREWLFKAVWFAAGLLLGSAVVVLGCLFSGAWSGFVEEQFEVLPRYAATAFAGTPHYGVWAAGRIQTWLGFWTVCAALAAVVIAWRRNHLARLAPALVGAAAGFAALAVQIRYQPYYFETCYPFFAIFWAYLGIEIYEGARSLARTFLERNWRVACVLTWVLLANLIALCLPGPVMRTMINYKAFNEWRPDPAHFYSSYTWPGAAEHLRDVLRVVHYLDAHPAPAAGVYVWGNEPLIYYLSGYQPPTRFVWNLALMAPWRMPGWRRELVRQLMDSRPQFIIVARYDEVHDLSGTHQDSAEALRSFPALAGYLRDFYQPCKDVVTFEIYCRSPRSVAAGSAGPPS